MKRLTSLFLAVLMLLSVFAVTASALEPTADSTNLIVKKYQVRQVEAGKTPLIGNASLKGVASEDPNANGSNYDVLAGVEFTMYRLGGMNTYVSNAEVETIDKSYNNGNITYNNTQITPFATATTNANGLATFNVEKADFGLFFVKETKAPEAVTAKSQSFVVMLPRTNETGDGFLADTYVFPKNYVTLGGGILRKVDSTLEEGKQGLKGAQFALYNAKDDSQVTVDYLGGVIGDANNNNYLTTDDNGYIAVNNLPVGEYYFLEKVAPSGYDIRNDKHTFFVEAGKPTEVIKNNDGTYTYTGITLLKAENSSQPQIDKYVTSDTKEFDKKANVAFGQKINWIIIADVPSDMGSKYSKYLVTDTMDAELDFVDGTVTVSTTTDTNLEDAVFTSKTTGYTVSSVEKNNEGKYVFTVNFTDTAALAGVKKIRIDYKTTLNETATVMGDEIYNDVRLDYANNAVADGEAEEDDEPYVYTGGFKFLKVSTDDSVLEGAVFDVYSVKDDKNPVRTGVTSDNKGIFEVKGLKDGDYYLVETKAPAKHELLTTKFNFTVTKTSYDESSSKVVKVTNVPIPDVPLTGGIGTTIFTLAGLSLIALAAVLFVLSRKTKKSN